MAAHRVSETDVCRSEIVVRSRVSANRGTAYTGYTLRMSVEPEQLASRSQTVHRLAEAEGFAMIGIAPAAASERGEWVRSWIAQGRHGEMEYLARRLDVRLDPARFLPKAASVIVVADFYAGARGNPATGNITPEGAEEPAVDMKQDKKDRSLREKVEPRGRIARYALGDDYHKVMTRRLHRIADTLRERFPQADFKCTVDTAPMLEREHAERAGLGWCGKHTLLIHPRFGSWMLLGTIVTTLKLRTTAEANYPGPTLPPTDHCGSCTRCIDACPTQCIENPDVTGRRAIDARRCISYLTLEHRGPIAPELHEPMGDWLAGCDVCQQVCPFNRERGDSEGLCGAAASRAAHPRYEPRPRLGRGLALAEVLEWTATDRQEAFAGSALKRVKLDMLKRNALIAAGNTLMKVGDPRLRRRIEEMASDASEPELVRLTAQQVLARLCAS